MILLFSSFYFSSNWSVIYIQRHKAVSVHVFLVASTLSTTDLHYSFTNTYYCFPLHRTVPQSGQTLQSTEGNIAVNRREHCNQQKGTLPIDQQWNWLTNESIQSVCGWPVKAFSQYVQTLEQRHVEPSGQSLKQHITELVQKNVVQYILHAQKSQLSNIHHEQWKQMHHGYLNTYWFWMERSRKHILQRSHKIHISVTRS